MSSRESYEPWLTDKEFYILACRYADSKSIHTAAKWWRAFNEVCVHELHNRGKCRLPNIGTFGLRHVKESKQTQKSPSGRIMEYRVPERYVPTFSPHDTFTNDVNYRGVTKEYRKRLKNNALTQRDYERELRREAEEGEDKVEPVSKEQLDDAKAKFMKSLKQRQKKFNGKVEPEDEEE